MGFIIVNENNMIVDIASEEVNLCIEALSLPTNTMYKVDPKEAIMYGDEYDSNTNTITPRPDRRPQLTKDELAEIQIQAEMRRLSVANLKTKGTLPSDFVDPKAVEEIPILTEVP